MRARLWRHVLGWRVHSLDPLWPTKGAFLGITFKPLHASIGCKIAYTVCAVSFVLQCAALTVAAQNFVSTYDTSNYVSVLLRGLHLLATFLYGVSFLVIPFLGSGTRPITVVHCGHCFVCFATFLKGVLAEGPLFAYAIRVAILSIANMFIQIALFGQCSAAYTFLIFGGLVARIAFQCRDHVFDELVLGNELPLALPALTSVCMTASCAAISCRRGPVAARIQEHVARRIGRARAGSAADVEHTLEEATHVSPGADGAKDEAERFAEAVVEKRRQISTWCAAARRWGSNNIRDAEATEFIEELTTYLRDDCDSALKSGDASGSEDIVPLEQMFDDHIAGLERIATSCSVHHLERLWRLVETESDFLSDFLGPSVLLWAQEPFSTASAGETWSICTPTTASSG